MSIVGGSWSDRIGRRTVIATGWLVYARRLRRLRGQRRRCRRCSRWFLVYGFYFGFAEGTEKALSPTSRPRRGAAIAFGVYNAVHGPRRARRQRRLRADLERVRIRGGVRRRRGARAARDRAAVRRRPSRGRRRRPLPSIIDRRMIRILVTNDDGYRSEGITALADALRAARRSDDRRAGRTKRAPSATR